MEPTERLSFALGLDYAVSLVNNSTPHSVYMPIMAQAQVQVSEVSDINNHVYSANSPIVVC